MYAPVLDTIESIVKYISRESAIGLYVPRPTMLRNICWPSEKYVTHRNTSCTCTTSTSSNVSTVPLLPELSQLWHALVTSPYTSENRFQVSKSVYTSLWYVFDGAIYVRDITISIPYTIWVMYNKQVWISYNNYRHFSVLPDTLLFAIVLVITYVVKHAENDG